MANKKITDLMSGTPVRDSLLESAIDISGTMDSRKVKAGAVADLASANVAAPYDSTVTYAIGQYCLQEGNIYRCIAPTTGAFDSTAWVQIVVTGEFRRVVELTSAQYTALTSAEKNNGTLYVITDEETTAADIPYSQNESVADKLSEIPTLVSGTVSVLSGVTMRNVRLYKYGRVVYFRAEVKVDSPTSWQTIATIPIEYRPSDSVYGVMDKTSSAAGILMAHIDVEVNGNVRLANLIPDANSEYRFALTWIIE